MTHMLFAVRPARILTREDYERIDRGYAAIPPKKKGKTKKEVRMWSAKSLAKKDSTGSANSCASKPHGKKWNTENDKTKIPLRLTAKSVAMLLKRFYGLALDADFESFDCMLGERRGEGESIPMEEESKGGTREIVEQKTVLGTEMVSLAVLLRKLYGYVIMKSMTTLFNKVSWRHREAVKAQGD